MVSSTFTLASGVYITEQALARELGYFMDTLIGGWGVVKVITPSTSDYNAVYFSDGSNIGVYDRFFVRIQAIADSLRFNVLSRFDTSTDTDYDLIGGTTNDVELLTSTSSGTYWFIGNADAIHVIIETSSLGPLHGGFGLWETYYSRPEDPKPFYVFGQTAQSQTFESAFRLESYGPRSWGDSMSAVSSGTGRFYKARHPVEIAQGTLNPRSDEPKFIEPVFYTDVTFPFHEIRGEVPGLYMCGGEPYVHGNVITVTGTLPGASAGDYFIHKHTNTLSWAIGPIITTVTGTNPFLFPGQFPLLPACHLNASTGVTALFTTSGTVSVWADQSGSGNDWSQTTESRKPLLIPGVQNGLPAIFFDGSDDLLTASAFISGSTPGEIFIVLRNARSAATNDGLWNFGSSTSDTQYTFTDDAIYDGFGSSTRKSTGTTTVNPREWHVYNVRSASGDWTSNQNFTQHFTTASNAVGWRTGSFKFGESETQDWSGYVGEIIIYDRILTSEERTQAITYLVDRWGVVV